jgi:cation transport regulator ChaC
MEASDVWYFAYGSNLNIGQMMTRVGEWTVSKRAVAKGYKLVFNVQSKRWGGLAANLVRTDNIDDRVYGAIYLILKEKLNVLTRYEGPKPTDILVEADGIQITAKAYVFLTSREPGKPPDAYLEVMLVGLRQHGYSEEVIEKVKNLAKSE